MNEGVKKVLIFIVVMVVVIPLIPMILPKPMTFDRIKTGLEAKFTLDDYNEAAQPMLQSIAQVNMYIDSAQVSILQYDDEGKIVKQREYQKKDAGQAIVETWGLAQSLGAAIPKETPSLCDRRGMFLIIATGPDKELLKRIIDTFKSL
ncbi:MAG TPA: hypothetical protein PLI09_11290 [Candidatus Hydrogenedentes bacterium]|nr:hypothetical protein [Candidatus Hydrogenedentota bacterium]